MAEGVLVVVVLHGRHMGVLHDTAVCIHGVSWGGGGLLGLGVDADTEVTIPRVGV